MDSLKEALDHPLSDENKADILLQLGRLPPPSERESSIAYYIEALEYIQDPFTRGSLLDTIGLKYWHGGDYPESIKFFQKSLSLFIELNDSLWLVLL